MRIESKDPFDFVSRQVGRERVVYPLTWCESGGLHARGKLSPANQESQQGAHSGTGEFAPAAVFTGGFVPHKVGDLWRVQRWPIHMAGGKTGREKTPSHPQIVRTRARGNATDLIQVLLIAQQPLIGLGTRRVMATFAQAVVLTPELQQMRQALRPFGQSARRRPLQSTDVLSDERGSDISNGVALLGQPLPELSAASQVAADTLPRVPLLGSVVASASRSGPNGPHRSRVIVEDREK